jgi:hypothetical protein
VITDFALNLCAALFSFYLTPPVGDAELTIGGIGHSKFQGDFIYPPLAHDLNFEGVWQLTSPHIFVNDKTTSVLQISHTVLFESAISNVLFDTQTALPYYIQIVLIA